GKRQRSNRGRSRFPYCRRDEADSSIAGWFSCRRRDKRRDARPRGVITGACHRLPEHRVGEPAVATYDVDCGCASLIRISVELFNRSQDALFHFRRNDLRAANKHAGEFRRLGFDRDRQDRVGRAAGDDVKDPQPFLKPRITPRLDHRGGLFFVKPLLDERLFKLAAQRFDRLTESRPSDRRFAFQRAMNPPARFAFAVFEEDDLRNLTLRDVANDRLIVFQSGREREVEIADAAVEEELLLLDLLFIAETERRGVGLARRVVMASALINGKLLLRAGLSDEGVPVYGLPLCIRQRIPLGKAASRKINFHRGANIAVRVKINDRRLHPHQRQINAVAFETLAYGRSVDERWQFAGPVQRIPQLRLAIGGRDRSESPPFVRDKAILSL